MINLWPFIVSNDACVWQSVGSDDLQLVRESLRCLRTSLPSSEPQLQAIDALEQSITSLVERLHITEQSGYLVRMQILPYVTEVLFLARGWLRDHAIFFSFSAALFSW